MAQIQFENGVKVNFEGNPTQADIEEIANSIGNKSTAPAPSVNSNQKSVWSALGADVTPQMQLDHPVLSGIAQAGQDMATIPGNFLNQILFNAPRALLNKAGYDYPKADSPEVQNVANVAGAAGALSNPLKLANPLAAGAAYGALYSTKDNIGLDQKSLLNRAIGSGEGAAGGALLSGIGKAFNAGDVINRYIGTRKKDFLFGKNPGTAVADEGILASSPDDLSDKIGYKLTDYGKKINTVLGSKGGTVNILDQLKPLNTAINKAAGLNDQALVDRLNEAKTAITNNLAIDPSTGKIQVQYARDLSKLTLQEATEVKRIVGEKTNFTNNPSADKFTNNALLQVYGGIRKQIENVAPEVAPLNQRYADLKAAQIAISRKDFSKPPITSLLGGIGRGAIGGLLTSGGNLHGAMIGSVAEPILERAVNNAKFKTAQALLYSLGNKAHGNILGNNQELLGLQNAVNSSTNQ